MTFLCTRFILPAALILLLVACDLPGQPALPTPWPADYLPTVVALTAQSLSTPTAAATQTAAPSQTSQAPAATRTPASTQTATPAPPLPSIEPTFLYFLTITPTPTPEAGRAAVYLERPGPLSKVTSPIPVRAWVGTRTFGPTRVELIGEDGRLITRQSLRTLNPWARIALDLPFEIRGASELARLQIITEARNGRVTGIGSAHVLLLSVGSADINGFSPSTEACLVVSPQPEAVITGGEVQVLGEMRPFNNLPVIFELWDADSRVLGTRIYVFGPADDSHQKFETSIPYRVAARTEAFLVVRQADDRIEGIRYLYSQPIILEP